MSKIYDQAKHIKFVSIFFVLKVEELLSLNFLEQKLMIK